MGAVLTQLLLRRSALQRDTGQDVGQRGFEKRTDRGFGIFPLHSDSAGRRNATFSGKPP